MRAEEAVDDFRLDHFLVLIVQLPEQGWNIIIDLSAELGRSKHSTCCHLMVLHLFKFLLSLFLPYTWEKQEAALPPCLSSPLVMSGSQNVLGPDSERSSLDKCRIQCSNSGLTLVELLMIYPSSGVCSWVVQVQFGDACKCLTGWSKVHWRQWRKLSSMPVGFASGLERLSELSV